MATLPPPPVAPPAAPRQRKDTAQLKDALLAALGGERRGDEYLRKLKAFLVGQITRSDLDQFAGKELSAKHVKLHNALILSILYNVQKCIPRPGTAGGGPDAKGTHPRRRGAALEARRVARQHLLSSLTTHDKARIMSLLKDGRLSGARSFGATAAAATAATFPTTVDLTSPAAAALLLPPPFLDPVLSPVPGAAAAGAGANTAHGGVPRSSNQPPSPTEDVPAALLDAAAPPSCTEEQDLPSPEHLAQRVHFLSSLEGMQGPGVEVLEMLSDALEDRLCSILQRSVETRRPWEEEGSFPLLLPPCPPAHAERADGMVVDGPTASVDGAQLTLGPEGARPPDQAMEVNVPSDGSKASEPMPLTLQDLQFLLHISPHLCTGSRRMLLDREVVLLGTGAQG